MLPLGLEEFKYLNLIVVFLQNMEFSTPISNLRMLELKVMTLPACLDSRLLPVLENSSVISRKIATPMSILMRKLSLLYIPCMLSILP